MTRDKPLELVSTLTCPACGAETREIMPTNACACFCTCPHCASQLRPKPADRCVFCSYVRPPKQGSGACACG